MSSFAQVLRGRTRSLTSPAARAAVEAMTYELIPLRNVEQQIAQLPPAARVSVTASPAKTLEDTLDLCARLLDRGHRPVPHLAARMVEGATHLRSLAGRVTALGLREVFCIAGDHQDHHGYPDAVTFLRPFLEATAGEIDEVGVSGYPDGHAFIDRGALRAAMIDKQALFADADVRGSVSTQMCFSADTIRSWIRERRADGLTMPIHLGVPGVVDRAKLLTMGMRLGVGPSLRYLRKNRNSIARLFATTGYDPGSLVEPLARDFAPLGIERLHVFTFNHVAPTREWQRVSLG